MIAAFATMVAINPLQAVIRLDAQNESRETGTATLVPRGNATRVTIVVSGEPQNAVQPANIHLGSCDSVRQIGYRLQDVRDGRSTTLLPASLAALMRHRYVIVLQESPASLRAAKDYRYVSCGAL